MVNFSRQFPIETIYNLLAKILLFLVIFIIFYLVGQTIRKIIRRKLKVQLIKREIVTFTSDLVFYAFIVLGLIVGSSNIGLNMNAVVASLGLGGFAIGLALKDIIANFMSGFLIIISKTFKVGDYLKVTGGEGIIKSINLRHTVIAGKNNPKERIFIPNSNIFSSVITIIKKESLKKTPANSKRQFNRKSGSFP